MSDTRSYPRQVKTDAGEIEFRLMSRADEAAVLAFAQKLPTHDLLFLPRNISQPKVLSAWINEIERGDRKSTSELQSLSSISYAVFCLRSEERRVGKECSLPCRSRWSPYH